MQTLLAPATLEDFIRLLRAWRFWVLGALLGGLLGSVLYLINPPDYRARATVVVSFNMEKSWPNKPDNELFYYLERESRKLVEVAWSDTTLEKVSAQTNLTISTLRSSGILELSQPKDGAWHFYASDPSDKTAAKIATAWAEAFTNQVHDAIQSSISLDAARKALEKNPTDASLQAMIKNLEGKSLAITPELEISYSQGTNLPAERKTSLGIQALAGAVSLLTLTSLAILFLPAAQLARSGGKKQK